MTEQLLLLLQALFLILLYVFIWRVVRAGSRDLRVPQDSVLLAPVGGGRLALDARRSRLVVISSTVLEPGQVFDVDGSPVTIGRGPENEILLEGDEYASARHARVEPYRDGVWVVDLGSSNGTFVNGEPVMQRRQLRDGDHVHVGATELRLEA
jgi:hypothetical protein